MKRFLSLVLALSLLASLLTACGGEFAGEEPSPPLITLSAEENDELTHKLLADWYGYLIRCEYLYGDFLWALSYLEPFLETPTWDNLQIARTALAAASRKAEFMAEESLEQQMTTEDYHRLTQAGADISTVQITIDGIPAYLVDPTLLAYQSYQNHLSSPVEMFFLTYDFDALQTWAHIQKQACEYELRLCAVQTDYLLLTLTSETEEEKFLAYTEERCPQIFQRREGNPQDADGLEALSAELIGELETLVGEMSSMVGQQQAALELERDASAVLDDSGKLESLHSYVSAMSADAVELQGFPPALPYPNWQHLSENVVTNYFWDEPIYGLDDEGGSREYIWAGETIPSPPDFYIVTWMDVSLDDYFSYLDQLKSFRITPSDSRAEDGSYTTFFDLESSVFSLLWEEDTLKLYTLEGSVCFAPDWFLLSTSHVFS